MKKICITSVLILAVINNNAQISWLSASKLASLNTSTLPKAYIEFEL